MTRLLGRALVAVAAAATGLALALPASAAAPAAKKLTLYAAPATVQFMNHADDRLRGMSTNPFNQKAAAVIIDADGNEKANGPFPGDDILYGFKLFADAKRAKPLGAAMFTCYYQFAKVATCDSYFELEGGVLLASGEVKFGTKHFVLGVVGGRKAYFAGAGQVDSTPAAGNLQRFDLTLSGKPK